jgi:hypothetical protein
MTSLQLSTFTAGAWTAPADLGALGFADPIARFRSRATSTLTLRFPGADPSGAPAFPFRQQIRLYATGIPSLNAGAQTIIFAGSLTSSRRRAFPSSGKGTILTFSDAWWDLENTPFEHFWWSQLAGQQAPQQNFFGRIFLFQNINNGPNGQWGFLSAQAQLQQILGYAQNNCGIAIQAGTIDASQNFPPYAVRGVKCSEALLQVLKTVPDAFTCFDYTQNPPALNIRQRAHLTPITLPFAGTDANGRSHQTSDLREMFELQSNGVKIEYQQINSINGAQFTSLATDVYPPGTTGAGVQQSVIPIDLRGGSLNTVAGVVTSIPINPANLSFWLKYKPDLNTQEIVMDAVLPILDVTINGGLQNHPSGITIMDEASGALLTPAQIAALPYALTGNCIIAPWMTLNNAGITPVVAKEVIVTGYLRYARRKQLANGIYAGLEQMTSHQVTCRIKLTNSPGGNYAAVANEIQAEAAPVGLAQFLYNAMSVLQFEGTHVNLDADPVTKIGRIQSLITPANVLNFSGGDSNWTNINATIYETEIDFYRSATTVKLGPHKHVSANEIVDLLNMWSTRFVLDNWAVRNNGLSGAGNQVQIGTDAQKENTSHGITEKALQTIIGSVNAQGNLPQIQHDATQNGGQILIQAIKNADGTVDATQPSMSLAMASLTGINKALALRPVTIVQTDPVSGQPIQPLVYEKCFGLFTAPEALP